MLDSYDFVSVIDLLLDGIKMAQRVEDIQRNLNSLLLVTHALVEILQQAIPM